MFNTFLLLVHLALLPTMIVGPRTNQNYGGEPAPLPQFDHPPAPHGGQVVQYTEDQEDIVANGLEWLCGFTEDPDRHDMIEAAANLTPQDFVNLCNDHGHLFRLYVERVSVEQRMSHLWDLCGHAEAAFPANLGQIVTAQEEAMKNPSLRYMGGKMVYTEEEDYDQKADIMERMGFTPMMLVALTEAEIDNEMKKAAGSAQAYQQVTGERANDTDDLVALLYHKCGLPMPPPPPAARPQRRGGRRQASASAHPPAHIPAGPAGGYASHALGAQLNSMSMRSSGGSSEGGSSPRFASPRLGASPSIYSGASPSMRSVGSMARAPSMAGGPVARPPVKREHQPTPQELMQPIYGIKKLLLYPPSPQQFMYYYNKDAQVDEQSPIYMMDTRIMDASVEADLERDRLDLQGLKVIFKDGKKANFDLDPIVVDIVNKDSTAPADDPWLQQLVSMRGGCVSLMVKDTTSYPDFGALANYFRAHPPKKSGAFGFLKRDSKNPLKDGLETFQQMVVYSAASRAAVLFIGLYDATFGMDATDANDLTEIMLMSTESEKEKMRTDMYKQYVSIMKKDKKLNGTNLCQKLTSEGDLKMIYGDLARALLNVKRKKFYKPILDKGIEQRIQEDANLLNEFVATLKHGYAGKNGMKAFYERSCTADTTKQNKVQLHRIVTMESYGMLYQVFTKGELLQQLETTKAKSSDKEAQNVLFLLKSLVIDVVKGRPYYLATLLHQKLIKLEKSADKDTFNDITRIMLLRAPIDLYDIEKEYTGIDAEYQKAQKKPKPERSLLQHLNILVQTFEKNKQMQESKIVGRYVEILNYAVGSVLAPRGQPRPLNVQVLREQAWAQYGGQRPEDEQIPDDGAEDTGSWYTNDYGFFVHYGADQYPDDVDQYKNPRMYARIDVNVAPIPVDPYDRPLVQFDEEGQLVHVKYDADDIANVQYDKHGNPMYYTPQRL